MANNNKKSAGAVLDIVCNLTIVAAAIVLLVALCVNNNNVTAFNVLILVGCAVCALAAIVVLVRAIMVLYGKLNHRSPEYKNAITRTVFMGIVFALSVLGLVYAIIELLK